MHASFTLRIDFTDEWFASDVDVDRWDEAIDLLLDVDGVDQCCLDHCCWIELRGFDRSPDDDHIEGLKQKIREVIKEVSS